MKKFLCVASVVCAFQCGYGDGVTVYKDVNYKGNSVKYGVGNHNYNEIRRNNPGNDAISSVKIDPGYRVILYWDPNHRGRSLVLTKNTPNLVNYGANDQTSSLRVEKIPVNGLFKKWTNEGYAGNSATWEVGEYRTVDGEFSSVFIPKGYSVVLFNKQNFKGNVTAFQSQDSDIWIDDLKSIFPSVKSFTIEKIK